MKKLLIAVITASTVGCATITNDPMDPIALTLSDGGHGKCVLQNKRGTWTTDVPVTIPIRRSDDDLRYDCKTEDGREAVGSIPSTVGAKIVASAVFIDFGITDAITDKHRDYPASFVIPIPPRNANSKNNNESPTNDGDSAVDPFDYSAGGEENVGELQADSDAVDPLELQQ